MLSIRLYISQNQSATGKGKSETVDTNNQHLHYISVQDLF